MKNSTQQYAQTSLSASTPCSPDLTHIHTNKHTYTHYLFARAEEAGEFLLHLNTETPPYFSVHLSL